jgi:hypothetical protein
VSPGSISTHLRQSTAVVDGLGACAGGQLLRRVELRRVHVRSLLTLVLTSSDSVGNGRRPREKGPREMRKSPMESFKHSWIYRVLFCEIRSNLGGDVHCSDVSARSVSRRRRSGIRPPDRRLTITSQRRHAMAEAYPTRRKAKSSQLGSLDRRRDGNRLRTQRQKGPSARSYRHRSTGPRLRRSSAVLISQLREVSRLLGVVYSSCVTAELALEGQNADRDRDILVALRMQVSEPVSRQVEKLDLLVVELGGAAEEVRP